MNLISSSDPCFDTIVKLVGNGQSFCRALQFVCVVRDVSSSANFLGVLENTVHQNIQSMISINIQQFRKVICDYRGLEFSIAFDAATNCEDV